MEAVAKRERDTKRDEASRSPRALPLSDLAETLDIVSAQPTDDLSERDLRDAPSIPGYRIDALLGEGSFGAVYRARELLLDRDVAIKVPLSHRRLESSARQSFLNEARALAKIRHANVLTIYGVRIHDGQIVLITEFIDGESLDRVVNRSGPFDVAETARIGIDVARALTAVHGAGLVHRDLKTANLMREKPRTKNARARIVLADFGLGVSLDAQREEAVSAASADGPFAPRIAGSPLFMAPEQVRGDDVDARTDIYTLGVALYNLCTGQYPVVRGELQELLRAIEVGENRPLHEARGDIPGALSCIISRALARDPDDRFQSAEELEMALVSFLQECESGEVA